LGPERRVPVRQGLHFEQHALVSELLVVQRRRATVSKLPRVIPPPPTDLERRVNQEMSIPQEAGAGRTAASATERRRSRRVKVAVPARIRPYYETAGAAEELLTATNLSRDGFYFIARRPAYQTNMNLYVACPAGHSRTQAEAECARVVRVDPLDGNAWGVAVAFLRSAFSYHRGNSFQK
jgi:hypothetical protein